MLRRAVTIVGLVALVTIGGATARAGIQAADDGGDATTTTAEVDSLESIALLPPPVRALVLEAALHPDLLDDLAALQSDTNRRMSTLAADLPSRQRQMAWQLLAHPALVEALVSAGTDPRRLVDQLAAHPEPIAEAGRTLVRDDADTVRAIHALQSSTAARFDRLLVGRSAATQVAFRTLLDDPRALSLVMTRKSLLRSLGVLHRNDPSATAQALDQIAASAIAEHRDALPGWQQATDARQRADARAVPVRDDAQQPEQRDAEYADGAPVGTVTVANAPPNRPPPVSAWLGGCASRPATTWVAARRGVRQTVQAARTAVARTLSSARVRTTGHSRRVFSTVAWPPPDGYRSPDSTRFIYKRRSPPITLRGPRSDRPSSRDVDAPSRSRRDFVFSRSVHGWKKRSATSQPPTVRKADRSNGKRVRKFGRRRGRR